MDNCDLALAFVEHYGVPVFPVRAGKRAKAPYITDPYNSSSTDKETIRNWWATYKDSGCAFACYPGRKGYAVIDIDCHEGKANGAASMDSWEIENGMNPSTLEVTTPSGGTHLWYKCSTLTGGKDNLLPGVDIHGGEGAEGRYVLLPCQKIAAGEYALVRKMDPESMPSLPQKLSDAVNRARAYTAVKAPAAPAPVMGAGDTTDFAHVLQDLCSMSTIEAGGRDNAMIALALDWKERGMNASAIFQLFRTMDAMGKIEQPAGDPMDDSDFRRIAQSAWKKQSAVYGSGTVRATFESKAAPLVNAADLVSMDLPPPQFIVRDLLPEGLTFFIGAAKAGKTYLALQLATAVAEGAELLDFPVTRARKVLYCYLEGGLSQIKKRLSELYGEDYIPPRNLMFATKIPPLDAQGLEILKRLIDSSGAELVIIDTWQLTRVDGDGKKGVNAYQKEYKEISVLYDEIIRNKGVSMILVHHQKQFSARDGLDAMATASGSMAIPGASDTMLVFSRERGAETARLEAHGRNMEDLYLELVKRDPMGWDVIHESNSVILTGYTDFQCRLIDMIGSCEEGCTPHELAVALPDLKFNSILQQLRRWHRDGKLDKCGKRYRLFGATEDDNGL